MKKLGIVLLTVFLIVNLFGCTKSEPVNPYPERDVSYPVEIEKLDEDSIQIHYQREDQKYEKWTLWLWDPEGSDDSVEDDFNYQDDYGVVASYPLSYFGDLSSGKLGIIVKTKGSWTKDGTDSDRFINLSNMEKDENGVYHIYLVGDDANLYYSTEKKLLDEIETCMFYNDSLIYVVCTTPIQSYRIYSDSQLIMENDNAGKKFFSAQLSEKADFTKNYQVEITFKESQQVLSTTVSKTGLYSTEEFNSMYYYDGSLGAIYSHDETTFKVWSPVSSEIVLRIYESGTPTSVNKQLGNDSYLEYPMVKQDKGVFMVTVSGDLAGKYYTYVVTNDTYKNKEVVDPYAYSTGINGARGMIVDFDQTNPEGWDDISYLELDSQSLTVWETHVADVTSSDSWNGSKENQRKYLGLIEENTTYSENGITVSTGFDHIKELGVNAVQLIPIFDQDNDETKYTFNWGYNPLNYNSLEGLYSSDPYDGYAKIREFKQVVMAYNEAKIGIIMDVVYNHVSGAIGSNFDVLMPGYYYRYQNQKLSNGSGCGNETASENAMMRKFIVDSVSFWCKEYKLAGFRFDLMGLHDLQTMNEVAQAVHQINPYAAVYGEPWAGGTSTLSADLSAKQVNANKYEGYGQFNDQMRDALIKGGLCAPTEKGWVTTDEPATVSDIKAIQYGIQGITYNPAYTIEDSKKTVNYVTCHDNYTLVDRIKLTGVNDQQTILQMAMLANSIVLTSNSTTFILAGEEMARSKQGDGNSYKSSDEINGLDYSLKIQNMNMFENYVQLIHFKQNTDALSSEKAGFEVQSLNGGSVLMYSFESNGKSYIIIHGNSLADNYKINVEGYHVVLDTLNVYSGELNSIEILDYQSLILEK